MLEKGLYLPDAFLSNVRVRKFTPPAGLPSRKGGTEGQYLRIPW